MSPLLYQIILTLDLTIINFNAFFIGNETYMKWKKTYKINQHKEERYKSLIPITPSPKRETM